MAHLRSSRFNIEFFGNPAASNRIKTLATDPSIFSVRTTLWP